MKAIIDKLTSQAMSLPSESRAQLAEKLIESLESETIEKLWLSEARKRRDEIRNRQVKPIDGEEALNHVKKLIYNK
jgi:hypothetical protein